MNLTRELIAAAVLVVQRLYKHSNAAIADQHVCLQYRVSHEQDCMYTHTCFVLRGVLAKPEVNVVQQLVAFRSLAHHINNNNNV
eukprot:7742-Heterococcus_DN1.PRE.3